jgi:hypothetical protein
MMTSSIRKTWIPCLAWGALAALATFVGFEVFYPVRLPPVMQGKWRVVEGKDLQGATLEFLADGRMIGTIPIDGKETTISGRVALDGNHFRVTTVNPAGGDLQTQAEEILELSERHFAMQDAQGEVLIMERPPAAGGGR